MYQAKFLAHVLAVYPFGSDDDKQLREDTKFIKAEFDKLGSLMKIGELFQWLV